MKKDYSTVTKWTALFAVLLGAGAFGAIQAGHEGGKLTWAATYAKALAEAKQTHKPVLLSFHLPECNPCAKMDAVTFSDPRIVAQAQQFVCVRLDTEMDASLVADYKVDGFPTTLFLDEDGKQITPPLPGYIDPDKFSELLKVVLKLPKKPKTTP